MRRFHFVLIVNLFFIPNIYSQVRSVENPLEWPEIKIEDDVFVHTGFACLYNCMTLIPNWVAWELTDEEANPPEKLKGKETFRWDPETHGNNTAYREDYKNDDGWQRGHMAPKADMCWSVQAYEESFYLSNICPQNGTLNGKDWLTTENMARRMAKRYGRIYIICGPIIGTNKYGTLGEHKVVIPDAFYKAFLMIVDGHYQSLAMVLPNEPTHHEPQEYWCTVNELEELIGMDLFPGLDDDVEEAIEGEYNKSIWSR
jgi:endonuclease G